MDVRLGYCESETFVPVFGGEMTVKNRGLTAWDYSCPKHKDKPDAD